ncbi:hypothetical protein D3C83_335230 [compost metagenome]
MPTSSARGMTRNIDAPSRNAIAATIDVRSAPDATERSICPAMITKVIVSASRPMGTMSDVLLNK